MWLDKCWKSHIDCQATESYQTLTYPRRVVDLGEYDTTETIVQATCPPSVRVLETNQTRPKYLAISYRWPQHPRTASQLNITTIDRLSKGIATAGLPQAYRDSFTIEKLLGVRYVWIDALCITQGKGGDWRKEAPKMASIYGNAILTIAFGNGDKVPYFNTDSDLTIEQKYMLISLACQEIEHNFIHRWFACDSEILDPEMRTPWRHTDMMKTLKIIKLHSSRNSYADLLRADGISLEDETPEIWSTCTLATAAMAANCGFVSGGRPGKADMETPESIYSWLESHGNFLSRPTSELDYRGWTFQERLLSKRVLTVTEHGLFWDCCSLSTTDKRLTRLKGDHSPEFRDYNERALRRQLLANTRASAGCIPSEIYPVWRRMVRDYSQRTFTHLSDRVIAIQGVVDRMELALSDRCLLGIWERDAIRSLVWFCDKPDPQTEGGREGLVKVPSWSWASVAISVHHKLWHPMEGFKDKIKEVVSPCASLLSIDAQLIDETRFSAYRGEVVLYGTLVELPLGLLSGPGYQTFTDKARYPDQEVETFSFGGVGAASVPVAVVRGQHSWTSGFMRVTESREIIPHTHSSNELFLLPMFRENYSSVNQAIYCLHLAPQPGKQYYRNFDLNNVADIQFVRKGITIIDESNCQENLLNQIRSSRKQTIRVV
ncbi:het domain protein [Colletotrichum chrysophilum]|uniref:Het domain protein n=1 Tax=Colletotrichum chrysophilum TaxID=1836956 RepID=A0AAD9EPK2_9PEZI|nr:het domain protein [Colletotrichum chrysophilum]